MSGGKLPINIKRFLLTIVLPTLLTIGVFILLIFCFIIPYFEQNMLQQKKEMIREVISSSVSIAATSPHATLYRWCPGSRLNSRRARLRPTPPALLAQGALLSGQASPQGSATNCRVRPPLRERSAYRPLGSW